MHTTTVFPSRPAPLRSAQKKKSAAVCLPLVLLFKPRRMFSKQGEKDKVRNMSASPIKAAEASGPIPRASFKFTKTHPRLVTSLSRMSSYVFFELQKVFERAHRDTKDGFFLEAVDQLRVAANSAHASFQKLHEADSEEKDQLPLFSGVSDRELAQSDTSDALQHKKDAVGEISNTQVEINEVGDVTADQIVRAAEEIAGNVDSEAVAAVAPSTNE